MRLSTAGPRAAARAGAVVTALASVAVLAGTAQADSASFTDRHGDIRSGNDILRVRVVNGADGGARLNLVARLRDLGSTDRVDFWIDTDPHDRGPEYRASGVSESDFMELRAVDGWGTQGTAVPCRGFDIGMNGGDPSERARFTIPRRCLGGPGPVRVSVHSRRVTDNGAQNDWAPARHAWYPWVAR